MKNKIGWCSMTFNPVVGCKNHCEYCYGQVMNKRFKFIKNWNNPEWKERSFNKKFSQKPQRIFVGSMSEIYYWNKLWIQNVINKTKQYPQHTFQFLTKYPEVYNKWPFPEIPVNCWLGTTITKMGDLNNRGIYNFFRGYNIRNIRFVSFEPLLERIEIELNFKTNWVIIGAETGNRKEKVIPKREWIENIVDFCRENNIPIYLKDSLRDIYPIEMKNFPKNNL